MTDEKKNLLNRAIDAVTNRDEKAAAAAAKVEAEKAKQEAAQLRAKLAAQKRTEELKTKAAARAQTQKVLAEKAAAEKPVVKYVLKEGDTWTHVALKFYGHATEPYWRPIYEANRAMVGDDYRRIRPGMEIIIPEMPEGLKK